MIPATPSSRWPARLAALSGIVALLGSVGCSTRDARRPPVLDGGENLTESALLDVQIVPFDPGVEEKGDEEDQDEDDRVQASIRRAEASYFPCLLRDTLIATGQWGAVEIAPRRSDAFELTIEGKIRKSNGETLEMEIRARDASDRVWLRERYEVKTEADQHEDPSRDPYQAVFDEVAVELLQARGNLTGKDLRDIRTIAELRFAEDFAPDSLGGYLEEEDDRQRVVRLPAREDPTFTLVGEARGREAMFIATQSDHYERFCSEMDKPYDSWRKLAREEEIEYRRLRNEAILRKVGAAGLLALTVVAGMYAPGVLAEVAVIAGAAGTVGVFQSGTQKQTEANFHRDTLLELNESFEAEVEPMVVAVQGRTMKLSGTVEEQYDEWRRLLREIYLADSEMPGEIEFVSTAPEEEGTAADGPEGASLDALGETGVEAEVAERPGEDGEAAGPGEGEVEGLPDGDDGTSVPEGAAPEEGTAPTGAGRAGSRGLRS